MTTDEHVDKIYDKIAKLTDTMFHLAATQEQSVKNIEALTTDLRIIAKGN